VSRPRRWPSLGALRAAWRPVAGAACALALAACASGAADQPWFVLVSTGGKIIWKHDGWLSVPALEAAARKGSPRG
jgi:hypothetical protein